MSDTQLPKNQNRPRNMCQFCDKRWTEKEWITEDPTQGDYYLVWIPIFDDCLRDKAQTSQKIYNILK